MSKTARPLMFTIKEGDDIHTILEPGDSIFVYRRASPNRLCRIYRVLMFYQKDCVARIDYGSIEHGRYTSFVPNFTSAYSYLFLVVTHPSLLSLSFVSDPPLTIDGPNGLKERLGTQSEENS